MQLLIHVEGETEETFVNEVLAPHLYAQGYERVGARLIGNSRLRQRRGGIRSWSAVRGDIGRHLRGDGEAIATTMVDYYGLPRTGAWAWPGREAAARLSFGRKARVVEEALRADLALHVGTNVSRRFVPFVVMHEFEGLLFSDCRAFSRGIERPDLQPAFQAIRDRFETPEEINDSPDTAPSKRVLALIPHYQKPLLGTLAALAIGLEPIREECPHFGGWLSSLERLAKRR